MTVTGAQGSYSAQSAQNTQKSSANTSNNNTMQLGDGLGKDSFLQLLITQMRYQDPLEPAKDTEYIAQLAQFNSLEQMQNLNNKFDKMLKWSQMTQASSLIGKQIEGIIPTGKDTDNDGKLDTSKVSGVVKEVKYVDGEPMLVVGKDEVRISDVTRIYEAPAATSQAAAAQASASQAGGNTASSTDETATDDE